MTICAPTRVCRICHQASLTPVFNLGVQALTGVFPNTRDEEVPKVPVELMMCQNCGLVQLGHDYDLSQVFTDSYGYRSGLNHSMVQHLHRKVRKLTRIRPVNRGEMVVDIGSNDGTLLSAYPEDVICVGVDPLGEKWRAYYPENAVLIPSFFDSKTALDIVGESDRNAAIVTSIAMFYDLPDPAQFVRDVAEILDEDGIWHLEMSYLLTMLRLNAMDTCCQEHIEYYSFQVLNNLMEDNGLCVVDVEQNSTNGGSIALTVMHDRYRHRANREVIDWMLNREKVEMAGMDQFHDFASHARMMRFRLQELVGDANHNGKLVAALGASTKGNVLLQYCGFTEKDIRFVIDVNPDKFGCFTPGSLIPIVSEEKGRALKPDYLLVPIWHFRDGVIAREADFLNEGGKLIFPMPYVEVVG